MPNKKKPKNQRRSNYFCIRFNDDEVAMLNKYLEHAKKPSESRFKSDIVRSIIIDKVKDVN